MKDTEWHDAEESAWSEAAQAWYRRQLASQLRTYLLEQPAYLEALGAASPNKRDPYADGLERVVGWYTKRRAMVAWVEDSIYRPETLGGGWSLCPGAIRAALLRAVCEVLADLDAEQKEQEAQDQRHVEAWLRAEQEGTLAAGPAEPSRASLLARCGGYGERGTP